MKKISLLLLLFLGFQCQAQDTITTTQVKNYLDKMVCVKGKVASIKIAAEGKNMNYINIDKAYPENVFSVVMTNNHLEKLQIQMTDLQDKTLFITGTLSVYKNDPKQIPQIFNPTIITVKKD